MNENWSPVEWFVMFLKNKRNLFTFEILFDDFQKNNNCKFEVVYFKSLFYTLASIFKNGTFWKMGVNV